MPPLSPLEERIVAEYIKNGGNQSEAWRAAHPDSKAKPASVHAKASAFFKQDKVRLRIIDLQAKVEDKVVASAVLTLETHMEKLADLRDKAEAKGQMSAAIAAEVKRGELKRLYVKQVESGSAGEFARVHDDELDDFIKSETSDLYGVKQPRAGSKHH